LFELDETEDDEEEEIEIYLGSDSVTDDCPGGKNMIV
jgi:hypothetical protein